jgi:hypothetical protein
MNCNYLLNTLWVCFRPLWKVLVHAEMILLLLLTKQERHKFGGNLTHVLIHTA